MISMNRMTSLFSRSNYLWYLCVQIILLVIGCIANLVVIIIVRTCKQLHTGTNYFLVNLALADLFTAVAGSATDITNTAAFNSEISQNKSFCSNSGTILSRVYQLSCLSMLFKTVSNLTLMCLAIGRYNALVKTFGSLTTILQRKSTLALVWCVPALIHIIKIIVIKLNFYSDPKSLFDVNYSLEIPYLLVILIIPVSVIVYCYACVIKGICLDQTILGEGIVNGSYRHRVNMKVVFRLVIVTTLSLISSLPAVAKLFYLSIYGCKPSFAILILVQCFVIKITTILNPIIYSMLNYSFRQEILKLFRKMKPRPRVQPLMEGREQENDNQLES